MENKVQEQKPLKLNYKRTIYIGLAFFTILMLWQVYNTYCPLFLTDLLMQQYGGEASDYSYIVGVMMALDNILALFMLPLFGHFSDKTKTKLGKRMPFIIAGTVAAIILFPLIPIVFLYNQIVWLFIIMALVVLAMNIYRSPAVALMPDITPKPLRSKANAIINLVGYIGAIFAGAIALFISIGVGESGTIEYNPNTIWIPFAITSVIMICALILLVVKIRENKLTAELKEEMEEGERQSETTVVVQDNKPLPKQDKKNLIVLFISIFLWFFAFNSLETFGSSYAVYEFGEGSGWWGTAVIVMTICSIISFIPGGIIASKVGRFKAVLIGLSLMILGLLLAILFTFVNWFSSVVTYILYIPIALIGIGWAWVNVSSYPMVVEAASSGNVGKYTGYYYTFSMLAQSITPIAIGALFTLLDRFDIFFPYALIFIVLATIVFLFYKPVKVSSSEIANTNNEKQVKDNDLTNNDNNQENQQTEKINEKPVEKNQNRNANSQSKTKTKTTKNIKTKNENSFEVISDEMKNETQNTSKTTTKKTATPNTTKTKSSNIQQTKAKSKSSSNKKTIKEN